MRSPFRFLILFLVLTSQAFASGVARFDVLCVGRDGHVAIESPAARTACLERSISSTTIASAANNSVETAAGTCIDTPVVESAQAARMTTVKAESLKLVPAPVFLLVSILPPPAAAQARFLIGGSGDAPPHHPMLGELRTVILLV